MDSEDDVPCVECFGEEGSESVLERCFVDSEDDVPCRRVVVVICLVVVVFVVKTNEERMHRRPVRKRHKMLKPSKSL